LLVLKEIGLEINNAKEIFKELKINDNVRYEKLINHLENRYNE